MKSKKEIIEWRSEEIAKLLLRKSSHSLNIEQFPTPIFDFFVTQSDNPHYRFAVEVKTKNNFNKDIHSQLNKLVFYRNSGMINIPALIFKIDEVNENGEIEFLVVPSISGKLLIRRNYSFKKITSNTIDNYISKINLWWDFHK